MNSTETDKDVPDRSGPHWRPVSRPSTHQLVVEAIENQILAGELSVGDSLPAERSLAEQLQVSRAAVREAIRVLQGQGVLDSHVGSGHGAGTTICAMPSEALNRFLRLHVALSNFSLEEVTHVRMALEIDSSRLAAQNGDAAALERMHQSLEEMDSDTLSRLEFNEADTRFHVDLAHGAGNRLLADLAQAIRESLKPTILTGFNQQTSTEWKEYRAVLRQQHRAIYHAVTEGEADHAAELMEKHVRTAYQQLPEQDNV